MTKYKIYTKGNYIVIVDTQKNEYFYGIRKEVSIDKNNTNKTIYKFKNVKDFDSDLSINLNQIFKEDNLPYTETEFDTFYTENTGNFNGGSAINPQDFVTKEDSYITNSQSYTSKITFCLNNNIKDLNIIILSDSTGDGLGEWAYLTTQYLATTYQNYTINFRYWNVNTLNYQSPELIQTGNISSPKTLNVYLGGASGQGVNYGNVNFNQLFPVSPDLVMISYGHNDNYEISDLYMTDYLKLTKRIKQKYLDSQIILIGQNPKSSNQPTFLNGIRNVYDIYTIAGQEGYGFINIMQKFFDYGDYENDLLLDGIHPNTIGSELWTSVIEKIFARNNYNSILLPRVKTEKVFLSALNLSSSTSALSYISKAVDVEIPVRNLVDTTTNGINGSIILPYEWETVNVYVYWTTDTDSSSSNVYFNSHSYFLDSSVSAPVLGGGAFLIAPGGVAGKINKTQIYSYLGSGEYELEVKNTPFTFSITRLGGNASDTYAGDCRVIGILFERRL